MNFAHFKQIYKGVRRTQLLFRSDINFCSQQQQSSLKNPNDSSTVFPSPNRLVQQVNEASLTRNGESKKIHTKLKRKMMNKCLQNKQIYKRKF